MPGLEPGHRFRDGCLSRALRYHYSTSAWRRTQDSNLRVVSDRRFSRPLPRHPDIRHILVRPTGFEPVLAKANCPLKTACLPNSTRDAYFVLKLEAGGFKPPCHLPYRSGIASVLPYDLLPKAISRSYLINAI